jgi:uncharacterized protein (DUF736 family)
MPQIGQFARDKSGFVGRIETLTFCHDISLISAEDSDTENAPDYRVRLGGADGPEIGAGWKRSGEKAGEYVSIVIDDPALAQPIRANLFQSLDDKSVWVLIWSRLSKPCERSGSHA